MEHTNKHFASFENSQSLTESSPTRRIFKMREGAVHWLVAFREAEEQKYRHLQRRMKMNNVVISAAQSHLSTTLDGPFLVKPEDLVLFHKVVSIDASVNSLSLDSFRSFTSLRELDLALNGLSNLTFEAADFPHLQVLDLSFNSLPADVIIPIGQLPYLKVLHMTGNQLSHLPPDLGCTSPKLPKTLFAALEVLLLDDNNLTSQVFRSLAQLQRLKCLDLKGNHITEIPHLQENSKGDADFYPNSTKYIKTDTQSHKISRGSHPPFPELQYLNLSTNQIAEEEAVLAAALFPKLQELDIHSNPLRIQRNGDTSLLALLLEEEHGVKIKHKEEPGVEKSPMRMLADSHVKVKERVKRSKRKDKMTAESSPVHREGFFVTQTAEIPECEKASQDNKACPNGFSVENKLKEAKPESDVVETVGIQTAVRMLDFTLKNLNVYRDSKPKLDIVQMPLRGATKTVKKLPPLTHVKRPTEKVDEMMKDMKACTTITKAPLIRVLHDKHDKKEASLLMRDMKRHYKTVQEKTIETMATERNRGDVTSH